ncbi:hypothetical protein [Micromonospora sp. NPDC005203]
MPDQRGATRRPELSCPVQVALAAVRPLLVELYRTGDALLRERA